MKFHAVAAPDFEAIGAFYCLNRRLLVTRAPVAPPARSGRDPARRRRFGAATPAPGMPSRRRRVADTAAPRLYIVAGVRAGGVMVKRGADEAPVPPVRPLRVLVLTNGWPTARHPEYAVFNARQVESLRALGLSVDVAFVDARDRGKIEYLRFLPKVARLAAPYDLVHCYHGLSFLLARLGGVRAPLVVSFQNALEREFAEMPAPLGALAEALAVRLLRRGDVGVIFKGAAPAWLEGAPLVRRIPNGVDLDLFRPGDRAAARASLGIAPGATCLLFVSSKSIDRPQKRHDRFRAVAAALRARRPDLDVVELALVDAPPERVRLTYQAADVHVMTSEFEGSPNSVKEALASGLPVVSTDVGNVRDMIDGLAAARVLPAFDADAFAAAVEAAIAAPPEARAALRARLVADGLETTAVARRVAALYADVLAAGTSGRSAAVPVSAPGAGSGAAGARDGSR